MNPPQAPAKNRRAEFRRVPKGSVKATCRKGTLDLGPSIALAVLDISQAGIRLRLGQGLAPREEATVTLEGLNTPRPLRRVCRVVWCREEDRAFVAGLRFDKPLSWMELHKLS